MLVRGYERAKFEEQVHYRQRDLRRYERLFERYAYPMNNYKFVQKDTEDVLEIVNKVREDNDLAASKI